MKKAKLPLLAALLFNPFLGLAEEKDPSETAAIVLPPEIRGEETAILTTPPEVPPPITRKHATKVIVHLEVVEKVMRLADGVDYTFWTFGGTVPGKFIRIRKGDFVEFHLQNHPDSKMPHNIDLHAVNGPGGGATSSFTAPGHESVFSFQALNEGLFVYHCATAPVAMHVANGMYGLILVEPEDGLPKVDREYYVMQGDFYTKGRNGDQGLQPFDMEKAIDERADYVVFNGAVGAIAGDKSLKANVGEKVRIYFGVGGPNLTSSFHAIGEIFDDVRIEGGDRINTNVQTTLVPAGGSVVCEFHVNTPGNVILVDHSLSRAFNKGAIALLNVQGTGNQVVYSGKIDDRIYHPEGATPLVMPNPEKPLAAAASKEERIARGKNVFNATCMACHQAEGQGIPHAFPPLAGSDFLNADKDRAIHVVLNGLVGKVVVNGQEYNSVMPQLSLNNEDIANVLTYVYSQWNNGGHEITPEDVEKVRTATAK